MGLKKRRKFNQQWRKDRKVLKAAQKCGTYSDEALALATRYNIDLRKEKIK